jgi:signal transduction histidine kinase
LSRWGAAPAFIERGGSCGWGIGMQGPSCGVNWRRLASVNEFDFPWPRTKIPKRTSRKHETDPVYGVPRRLVHMSRLNRAGYNNGMAQRLLDELKELIGFTPGDEEALRSVARGVAPHLPRVIERFRGVVHGDPEALAVFAEGEEQSLRHPRALERWLRSLFEPPEGETVERDRRTPERDHVLVKLPQHYVITAIEVARQELEGIIRGLQPEGAARILSALRKRIALELGLVLDGYMQRYAERIRERERSAVEAKLTRAEHLAEIGQLAASLAHEIKNPLAGISGAIEIIGEGMPPDAPHRLIVNEILGQIRRLDAAVKDLLIYARPAPARATSFDLNEVMRRVLAVVRTEQDMQNIRFEFDGVGAKCEIRGDETQIEQLMINLVINAAQASAAGSTVRIATSGHHDEVVLQVADSGEGMSPEVLRRAFEPFYTTKAKGTGLGLSICRKIVEVHHGAIDIDSSLGEGTRVTVRLPRMLD